MGGPGSGNFEHRRRKKTTVENCLSIDANRWRRAGVLAAGVRQSGSWQWAYRRGGGFSVNYEVDTAGTDPSVRVRYTWLWALIGRQESADYVVRLATTRQRFGGMRWWFVCPLVLRGRPCGRRVGKLYLPPRGHYFACRDCHGLTYTSCQQSRKPSNLLRAIAQRLGIHPRGVNRIMGSVGRRCRPDTDGKPGGA